LQVKNKYHAVIKTLEARINNGGHCPHCKHHEFQKWESPWNAKLSLKQRTSQITSFGEDTLKNINCL